jgi:hypothetical protein
MAKALFKGTPWYVYVVFVVAIGLGVAGFCVPPQGEISGSVLTYIGEIIGGVTLVEFVVHIPAYLEAGVKAKISHGNTTIAVAADEVKDSELD